MSSSATRPCTLKAARCSGQFPSLIWFCTLSRKFESTLSSHVLYSFGWRCSRSTKLQTPMYVYYFLFFEYRLYYYLLKQINRELRGYLERAKGIYIERELILLEFSVGAFLSRMCFPFTDVYTDVEFDVCGTCVRLSTLPESRMYICMHPLCCRGIVLLLNFVEPPES